MHGTIKKKITVTHIYGFKLQSLSVSVSVSLLFFYSNFFWIYTWVYLFIYWVFDDLFILDHLSFAPH